MDLEKSDSQYKDVIENLKRLQKVSAPKYFEADLMRKINSEDFKTEKVKSKSSFWNRFVPSAALGVIAVIMLFVLNNNNDFSDDPLLAAPRERQDLISSNKISLKDLMSEPKDNLSGDKDISSTANENKKDSDENYSRQYSGTLPQYSSTNSAKASFAINKSGLNFRQIHLSKEDKKVIEQLREKLLNSYKNH